MTNIPKVLAVDDEPEILKLIQETLEIQGIACVTALNGQIALDLLQKYPSIQLVVSDINMPILGGIALREKAGTLFVERTLTWVALTTPRTKRLRGGGHSRI